IDRARLPRDARDVDPAARIRAGDGIEPDPVDRSPVAGTPEEIDAIRPEPPVRDDAERPLAVAGELEPVVRPAPEDLRRPLPRVPGAADVETRNAPGAPVLRRPDELRIVLIDSNTQRAVDRVARISRVGLDEVLPVVREDVDGT